MSFANIFFDPAVLEKTSLFVCAIGYESRSYHIFDKLSNFLRKDNTLILAIDDYSSYPSSAHKVSEITSRGFQLEVVKYEDFAKVQELIVSRVKSLLSKLDAISIDIDYSSMPRGWYCKLPELFSCLLREADCARFWYSEGIYPPDPRELQTAGIESYHLFSGKPTLQTQKRRTHIIGLSYDSVRTQGLISILDPEYIVTCNAYNPRRPEIISNVESVNATILDQAALRISFHVNDVEFMVSKMIETVRDFCSDSDVIIVPDGPKPLIFVMSMIPWLINKVGITCLHVVRNSNQFNRQDIPPTGDIIGFIQSTT